MSERLLQLVAGRITHPTIFTRTEIERYERDVLANSKADENVASMFFAEHPKFLLLGVGDEVRREVVFLDPAKLKRQRVDFFRRRIKDGTSDIIELKDPRYPFFVKLNTHHPRIAKSVTDALNQAEDYRDRIIGAQEVRDYLRERGIHVVRPRIIVISGQSNNVPEEDDMHALLDRIQRGPAEAWSYTDVFRFAKQQYRSNGTIIVPGDIVLPRNLALECSAELAEGITALLRAPDRFSTKHQLLAYICGGGMDLSGLVADQLVFLCDVAFSSRWGELRCDGGKVRFLDGPELAVMPKGLTLEEASKVTDVGEGLVVSSTDFAPLMTYMLMVSNPRLTLVEGTDLVFSVRKALSLP